MTRGGKRDILIKPLREGNEPERKPESPAGGVENPPMNLGNFIVQKFSQIRLCTKSIMKMIG